MLVCDLYMVYIITRGAWGVNERSEPMNNLVQMTQFILFLSERGMFKAYHASFSTDLTCKICCRESLDR